MASRILTPEQKQRRKEYDAARYAANREAVLARVKKSGAAYYQANREKVLERHAEWRAGNPTYHHKANAVRRARKALAGGALSRGIVDKLLTLQRGCCANCHAALSVTGKHLDHVVPLARGGANADHNVQLLCPTCNSRKNAKDPIAFAQEQGRLL